jgi:hypothetical protein
VRRRIWIGVALALLALGVWARWPVPQEPPAPAAPAPEAAAAPAPAPVVLPPSPSEPAAAPPVPEEPAAAVPVAQLRREAKFAREPLSDVEHELVGAWDDRGSAPELGAHRVLVAVVSPTASDAEIERLLRDARARHRDAEVLDVRVYDSGKAAAEAGWVGERKLVGELKRNDRLHYDAMTVRGRTVQP